MSGYRFPTFVSNDADAFRRFVAAPSELVHNPWPQLADRRAPEFAWSQPLIRAFYVPTTDLGAFLRAFRRNELPLPQWVAMLHEIIHLRLDFTPAKRVANQISIIAWRYVETLLSLEDNYSPEDVRFAVDGIHFCNSYVSRLCGDILTAEELIATAFSFAGVHDQLTTAAERQALKRLETDWVQRQASVCGEEFGTLYEGFQRSRALIAQDESSYEFERCMGMLATFVEPSLRDWSLLQPETPTAQSGDRCAFIAEQVKHMTEGAKFASMLAAGVEADLEMPVSNIVDTPFDTPIHATPLAPITRRYVRLFRRAYRESWERPLPRTKEMAVARITPGTWKDGRWIVVPLFSGACLERYLGRVLLDAFREQIEDGSGFHCPLRSLYPDDCVCSRDPLLQRRVNRLARWAQEGHFGEGSWSLSYPCSEAF